MNGSANVNKALAGYEPHVLEHCQSFLDLVLYQRKTALEVTNLLSRFTCDSMGILVSGKSFNMAAWHSTRSVGPGEGIRAHCASAAQGPLGHYPGSQSTHSRASNRESDGVVYTVH
jgi:hypothetical protein